MPVSPFSLGLGVTFVVREVPGFGAWTFEVAYRGDRRDHRGHVEITSVTATHPADEPFTPEMWERLPVRQLARKITAHADQQWAEATRARRAIDGHNLAEVAQIYRRAVEHGCADPLDALAVVFGVPKRTVERWLKTARDAHLVGYLAEERARAASVTA